MAGATAPREPSTGVPFLFHFVVEHHIQFKPSKHLFSDHVSNQPTYSISQPLLNACLPSVQFCWSIRPEPTPHLMTEVFCSCSVFFVGYTVTNICGGYLATRYTAKLILGLGVVAWSIFTMLTPVAASTKSVYVVLACRCLMGAGEGVTFPAIQHLQGKWLPRNRRTFANTLIFTGKACLDSA